METHAEIKRPRLHFTPPSNWMNDPNGLVYFNQEYHLFYQYHPYGTGLGPMHWGHAASRDLIKWEHLPIALAPDDNGVIFSGSAVVDWNDTTGFFNGEPGLVAIFTHHNQKHGLEPVESQSIAYSKDSGRTWIKYQGNPVLTSGKYKDFRDPKVFWHNETKQWVMILACGVTVCFYNSPDLKNWSFAGEFGRDIGSHDGVWECPDLFPLPVEGNANKTAWVMLVSVASTPESREGSRTQYFTGYFDGYGFFPDEASRKVRWLDFGRDNYAGVSWSDIPAEDGRRIYIGWMCNWKYADATPAQGWKNSMTIPRELALEARGNEIVLIQRPVREIEAFRVPLLDIEGKALSDLESKLSGLRLETYEIVSEFEPDPHVDSFGFKLRTSAQEETVVGYSVKDRTVFADRTRSGAGAVGAACFHEEFPCRCHAAIDKDISRIKLRILVDTSSIEVFVNDGHMAITELIYPSPESLGLSFFCCGAAELSYKVTLYEFKI